MLLLRIGYTETVASTSSILSQSLTCPFWWKPPVDCELPYGEAHVAGHWGWALAKRQQKEDGLSPTIHKGLCPGNTMLERLEMMLSWAFRWDCSPDQHIDWSLVRDLEAEAPCGPALRFLTNRDGENKWLLFDDTKFWDDLLYRYR